MLDKKVILVIEDEGPLLQAIKIMLEKNMFKVLSARTVDEALACTKNSDKIDAIWLDHYLLGEEDGLDFVRKLKEIKVEKIPIFVVSDTVTPDVLKIYRKLGISKYYEKAEHGLAEIIKDIRSTLNA